MVPEAEGEAGSDAIRAARALIDATAADESLSLEARMRELEVLMRRLKALVGHAAQIHADMAKVTEADRVVASEERLIARENADIREEMLRRGLASGEQLDEMGYLSHEELDRLEQEGRLNDALEHGPLADAIRERRDRD